MRRSLLLAVLLSSVAQADGDQRVFRGSLEALLDAFVAGLDHGAEAKFESALRLRPESGHTAASVLRRFRRERNRHGPRTSVTWRALRAWDNARTACVEFVFDSKSSVIARIDVSAGDTPRIRDIEWTGTSVGGRDIDRILRDHLPEDVSASIGLCVGRHVPGETPIACGFNDSVRTCVASLNKLVVLRALQKIVSQPVV